jgi:hypothetical protein
VKAARSTKALTIGEVVAHKERAEKAIRDAIRNALLDFFTEVDVIPDVRVDVERVPVHGRGAFNVDVSLYGIELS